MKATVPTVGKKRIDNAKENTHRCSDNEGKRVVEIGANRQSCDPSITLLFKLVLEVVTEVGDKMHARKLTP